MKTIALLFLLLLHSGSWALSIEAEFKRSTYQGTENVSLGELLRLRGQAKAVNAIRDLKIALLPYGEVINSTDISRFVAENSPHQLSWQEPGRLSLTLMVDLRNTVVSQAQDSLEQWLNARYQDFSIKAIGSGPILGDEGATITVLPLKKETLKKRMALKVLVSAKDGTAKNQTIWFSVAVYQPVLVAKQSIKSGEKVSEKDFAITKMDVTGNNQNYLPPTALSADATMLLPLSKDKALTKKHLANNLLVSINQTVQLKLVSPRMKLSTAAIALENGELGDEIEVMPKRAIESCMAKIIGKGVVQIVY